jgi:hypothetical protein
LRATVRQTGKEFRFRTARNEFKTARRKMMTFVHHDVSVTRDTVVHFAFVHEALHQRHVKRPGQFPPSATKPPNLFGGHPEKRSKTFDPLLQQLLPMDEYQRVHRALRNQPRGQNGLAEAVVAERTPVS